MLGLYIHIPFCVKKCAYCDFVSIANHEALFLPYIEALEMEAKFYKRVFEASAFDTVFIGGGTPSVLPAALFEKLTAIIHENFKLKSNVECTVEVNPGMVDDAKIKAYKNSMVNRLSIGLQSTNSFILKGIGRIHTPDDFYDTYTLAKRNNMSNINVDLMMGLPGQTPKDHEESLEKVTRLTPTHLSVYALILEEGTPLYQAKPKLPTPEEEFEMHQFTIQFLRDVGYHRYEISNYAKPGFECRHNLNYWDAGAYLGLGAAAHSAVRDIGGFSGLTRWRNTSDIQAYIRDPLAAQRDIQRIEKREAMFEFIMLGLRKTSGISVTDFENRFNSKLSSVYPDALRILADRNWLQMKNDRVFLTGAGLDMQNEALMLFME